jgi:hypothetical protein
VVKHRCSLPSEHSTVALGRPSHTPVMAITAPFRKLLKTGQLTNGESGGGSPIGELLYNAPSQNGLSGGLLTVRQHSFHSGSGGLSVHQWFSASAMQ